MGGGGVRRTQYRWNWEWGIKGGRGGTQDRGLGGSGGLGKGARSTGRTGGGGIEKMRRTQYWWNGEGGGVGETYTVPLERGGGGGGTNSTAGKGSVVVEGGGDTRSTGKKGSGG